MSDKETRPVSVKDDKGNQRDGVLHFTSYTSADRTKRAVLAWVGCWVAAFLTFFIPIAHFILVPAFLVAGPVMFFSLSRQVEALEKTVSVCPRCDKALNLDMETNDKLPKWTYCPACDGAIEISNKETQAQAA